MLRKLCVLNFLKIAKSATGWSCKKFTRKNKKGNRRKFLGQPLIPMRGTVLLILIINTTDGRRMIIENIQVYSFPTSHNILYTITQLYYTHPKTGGTTNDHHLKYYRQSFIAVIALQSLHTEIINYCVSALVTLYRVR